MERLQAFLGDKCYTTLLVQRNLADAGCLRLLVSKLLGVGVILGAAVVRVPQILKMMRSKSADGLSFVMMVAELISYSVTVAYGLANGYAFNTFGESFLMAAQNAIIVLLMFRFRAVGVTKLLVAGAIYVALLASFNFVTLAQLSQMQMACIPLTVIARVPQIYSNYVRKSTGQLSSVSQFMIFAGAAARIFTTLSETDSVVLLAGFAVGASLSFIIFVQILVYGDAKHGDGKSKSKSKSAAQGASKKAKSSKPKQQ